MIIGVGLVGFVFGRLFELVGIDNVIFEVRLCDYVEQWIWVGVLEHDTVELLVELGVGDRMCLEGFVYEGIELRYGGVGHCIDFDALIGWHVVLYG